MTVGQDLQAELLESYGEVSLRGAQIGVSLSLRGARLRNPRARLALNAPQLTVERTLYLTPAGVDSPLLGGLTPVRGSRVQRFACQGGIRLDDGRFGDAVDLEQARFVLTEEQELSLRRVQTPELRFLGERPALGRVVLSGARVVNLMDRADSWPGPGRLQMGGFTYENLVPRGAFPLSLRLDWVAAATAEYDPEPYELLAAVLRAGGSDEEAREVLLAKQRRRRAGLPLAARIWGYVQDWTVAYGYRPGRAACRWRSCGAGRQHLEGAVGPLPDRRRVRHTADPVERLGRVGPEPGAGPALGHRRGVGQPGGAGRHLVAVPDRHDGEPARLVLGRFQQLAHHGAVALLEHVEREHQPREQNGVQGEEREPDGGHDAEAGWSSGPA
ncbi:hypothetical protein SFUMM280S_00350 [Streptomyces fumanus]